MKNQLKNKFNIVIMIVTLASMIGVVFAIGLYIRDTYLETIAVNTEAKILSIDYSAQNNQRFATVTYKVDGSDIILSTPLDESQEELTVNDTIKIKYNIKNPGQAIYNEHLKEVLIIIAISLIGVILTTNKTINILRSLKDLKELKKSGIKVSAEISDIYIDVKSPKKNDEHPYRIRAKYLNPQDNKTYAFDSECIYNETREYITNNNISKVTVYINAANSNIYFVDLDSLKYYIESTKVEDESIKTNTIDSQETYEDGK